MQKLRSYTHTVSCLLISFFVVNATGNSCFLAASAYEDQDIKAVWETYSTDGEEFSVSMPELPGVIRTFDVLEFLSSGKRVQATYASYSDGVVYFVTSYQSPDGPPLEDAVAQRMKPSVLLSPNTVVTDMKLNGFDGKKFVYPSESKDYDILTAYYLTSDHLYEVTATGGSRNDPAIQKFFDSFSLGGKKGIEIGNGAMGGAPTSNTTPSPNVASPGQKTAQPVPNAAPLEIIFKPTEVDRKAVLIAKPAPTYTEEARQHQIEGTVILQMVFASTGHVTNIRTISGLQDGLTENAVKAARKIYFLPAIKNGKRVSQYMRVEYHFNVY